jgi:hypothetical protein
MAPDDADSFGHRPCGCGVARRAGGHGWIRSGIGCVPGFHKVEGDASALAAVPASSPVQQDGTPDGEAMVYLLDDYAKLFELIYTIHLTPQPKNASWSTLGVMLIGTENPGPSIQVGLAQENATTIKVFTTIGSASGADEYNGYPLACSLTASSNYMATMMTSRRSFRIKSSANGLAPAFHCKIRTCRSTAKCMVRTTGSTEASRSRGLPSAVCKPSPLLAGTRAAESPRRLCRTVR